jgi:hypothetical protein
MIFGTIWLALCVMLGKPLRSHSRSPVPELLLPIGADPAALSVGKPESASAIEVSS